MNMYTQNQIKVGSKAMTDSKLGGWFTLQCVSIERYYSYWENLTPGFIGRKVFFLHDELADEVVLIN